MRSRSLIAVFAVAALAFAGATADAARAPVKDGRYAGGAKRVWVFFEVSNRTIPYARVKIEDMEPCTGIGGPAVFDSDKVDAHGHFSLRDSTTFPGNTIKVSGRFTTARHVEGNVRWTTTANCPAGTYKFKYNADRYAPAS